MDPLGDKIENNDEKVVTDKRCADIQNPDKTNQLCAKCGQHFTSLIDLVHHFFKEHKKPGEDFDCPMCPKIISLKYSTSKASVMEHMRNTHLKETKKCPDCKQILKLTGYRKHRRHVHGIYFKRSKENLTPVPNPDGQYECPACKKVLLTKGSKYIFTKNYYLDGQNTQLIFFEKKINWEREKAKRSAKLHPGGGFFGP
jgi:hypothetical protein